MSEQLAVNDPPDESESGLTPGQPPLPGTLFASPQSQAGVASAGPGVNFTFNVGMITTSSHASPLPPIPDLERIEDYAPGATDRLLSMQEQVVAMGHEEQQFRHEMFRAESRRRDRGQHYGLIAYLVGVGAAIALALTGHDVPAEVVGGTTVASAVAVFVTGRVLRRNPEDEPSESS